jgi:hypothetical protein
VSGGAVHDRLHALHVGLPGAVGTTMRVGHLNAEGDALVAEFAFGHVAYLLAMRIAYQKASTAIITEILLKCKDFFKKYKKKSDAILWRKISENEYGKNLRKEATSSILKGTRK